MAVPYSRYIIGSIPWYSVLIVAGILLTYLLGTHEERRLGLPKDTMLDVTLVAVPCGIVGARIYYVLMELERFAERPISVLFIWEGGIAIYGAVIGGFLGLLLYSRKKKLKLGSLLDLAAPGLVLAQAIGRWGNYFNQEAFGPVVTDSAWQFFPFAVLIQESGAPVWHVATYFYESMWDLACFVVLWCVRKRMKRSGDTFLWYLVLYGSGRFLVEQLRMDSLYVGSFRASQYLSLVLCLVAAVVFLVRLAREQHGADFWAPLLSCVLLFARMLLPAASPYFYVIFGLYAISLLLTFLSGRATCFSKLWLAVDLAVYVTLLLTGNGALWQSPYFVYAGVSIPIYLSIPYIRLPHAQAVEQA